MLFWSIRNNQFEDPEGSAKRILYDDDKLPILYRKGNTCFILCILSVLLRINNFDEIFDETENVKYKEESLSKKFIEFKKNRI